MRRRKVVFAPDFVDDLLNLHDWLESEAGISFADRYIARIEAFCLKFDLAAERGTLRDDISPGLRAVGFERRATILLRVKDDRVEFVRLFTGGQDWERRFDPEA